MALQFRLRPLEPRDLDHLWTMNWDPLPRQISTFYLLCAIGHPRFCSVAVDGNGRIVAVLLTTVDEAGQWLYVNHLIVDESCRGGGVGTALMNNLESQCRAAGLRRIWLLTGVDVEPFYAVMGYRRDDSFMPPAARELMAARRPDALILSKVL
ncbi:MAG: GNAT family N-acetyltransferase [Phycisphaerae bacterium]|nr:GNAT family N-acetyltransferase [Phycisphaerae bacterium]